MIKPVILPSGRRSRQALWFYGHAFDDSPQAITVPRVNRRTGRALRAGLQQQGIEEIA